MKKMLLLLFFGIILTTNIFAQAPCSTDCGCVACPTERHVHVTYGDCEWIAHYKIYYCPGPPPKVQVHFESFEFPAPMDDDCFLIDPSQMIPLSYEVVVNVDTWFAFLYTWWPPCDEEHAYDVCINNVFSSYDAACWEYVPVEEHGNCKWIPCDESSCCIRQIDVCRHAYPDCSIYIVKHFTIYATACFNPGVNCTLFCDENY